MASAIAAQTAVVAQATQATRARGAQRVQACAGFKAAPLAQKQHSLKAAVAQRVAAPQVGGGEGPRGVLGGRLGADPGHVWPHKRRSRRPGKRIALPMAAAGRWLPRGGGDGQEVW